MKSKKRHELQTNILADWLGRHIEQLRPYANAIFAVVVVTTVVGIAVSYFISRQSAKTAVGWEEYFAALNERDSERLSAVAADHQATVVALWAKQSEGDLELARGNDAVYIDRDAAREALGRARECFEAVADGAEAFPRLQQRAQFSLAQAHESLGALNAFRSDKNDLQTAADLYAVVAQVSPGSALGSLAKDRTELLSQSSVENWYHWFSRQKPAPPAPPTAPGTGAGLSGLPGLPGPMTNLPDLPDFSATDSDSSPTSGEDAATEPTEAAGGEPAKPAADDAIPIGEAAKPAAG
ncbi:MAG: hypothetical protein ACC628_07260, partial [Pirellulaceae bacterium]